MALCYGVWRGSIITLGFIDCDFKMPGPSVVVGIRAMLGAICFQFLLKSPEIFEASAMITCKSIDCFKIMTSPLDAFSIMLKNQNNAVNVKEKYKIVLKNMFCFIPFSKDRGQKFLEVVVHQPEQSFHDQYFQLEKCGHHI